MDNDNNLSWWEKLKRRLFGVNQGSSQYRSSSSVTHFHSYTSDIDPIPVVVNNDSALIDDLASRMERQADRYENAGNFGQANDLRNTASDVRNSSDYDQALSIANTTSDSQDFQLDPNMDYSQTDFSDNS